MSSWQKRGKTEDGQVLRLNARINLSHNSKETCKGSGLAALLSSRPPHDYLRKLEEHRKGTKIEEDRDMELLSD